jgi:chromosome segregation ATPase
MSPSVALLVASLLGAVLFFVGGLLLGKRADAGRSSATLAHGPATEVGPSRAQLERQVAEGQSKLNALQGELEQSASVAKARLAALEAESKAQRGRNAELERLAASAQSRASELEKRLSTEHTQLTQLDRGAQEELARAKDEALRLVADVQRARAEANHEKDRVADLEQQLSLAESKMQSLLALAKQDAQRDHVIAQQQQDALKAQLLRAQAQVDDARRAVEDAPRLRTENATLLKEREQLLARGLVASSSPALPFPVTGTSSFEGMVSVVSRWPTVRAVSVGDLQGFVVASAGPHAEGLAALGAMVAVDAARASEFVPWGGQGAVSLKDDQGLTMTVHRFRTSASELTLNVLSTATLESHTIEISKLMTAAQTIPL